MVVYQITNNINGKQYIGQTINSLEKRFREHCRNGYLLTKAIKKYGKENFTIKILCECKTMDKLNAMEKCYIRNECTLSPHGYNLRSGGNNSKMHNESRIKVGNYHRGKILSEETRKKIRLATLGKRQTEETKEKRAKKHSGMKRPPHTGNKISLALRKDKRKVLCTNNGIVYDSAAEAGKILNLDRNAISKILRKKRKTTFSYNFIYVG